jgi:hypothetical protein
MSSRISEKVKTEILQEYVEPCYKSDIENLIKERNFWRKVGNYFDTFSKLSIGSSSIYFRSSQELHQFFLWYLCNLLVIHSHKVRNERQS